MALYRKMQKTVDSAVEEFCRRLAEQHSELHVEDMMTLWKETAKAPKKSSDKPKKRTAYMNFSQVMRTELKQKNPNITFGEISTQISSRWKTMTAEEKAVYNTTTTTPTTSPPASPVTTPEAPAEGASEVVVPAAPKKAAKIIASPSSPILVKAKKTKKEGPKKLTLAELKKLCKEKGLGIKGLKKREEFEELLESIDEDTNSSSGEEDNESDEEDVLAQTLVEASDDEENILG
jgi:hypothetical protein